MPLLQCKICISWVDIVPFSKKIAPKILVVGPAWVGDMVMAQTLFMVIKERQPDASIDVLAPEWSKPLLSCMPQVHRSIALPIGHGRLKIKKQFQVARELRREGYHQAILLPNSFKSAIIPFLARIPRRTGWRGEYRYALLNDLRFLNKKELPLMVERFMALGLPKEVDLIEYLDHFSRNMPCPALIVNERRVTLTRCKFKLEKDSRPVLALCPGAEFGSAKRWPHQHYAEVAKAKIAVGWQVWILGSSNDSIDAEAINRQTENRCLNLAGKTDLSEAIELLSQADSVVSNDSGLMHIAAALNRSLVVLYGSSSPQFTPPLNKNRKILRLGLSCSPCFKRECPLEHLNCLTDLKPKKIIDALLALEQEQEKGKENKRSEKR